MNEEIKKKGLGLRELPPDKRDFDSVKFFGAIDPKQLPEEYIVGKPIVKNQGPTDLCTAYAVTSASELQEGIELSPHYQFAKIKQIMGNPDGWGADLRSACKSAVEFGSLEEIEFPKEKKGTRDWQKLPPELDEKAKEHRKESYFSVGRAGDTMDSIKAALWQTRAIKRAVISGTIWRYEWTKAKGGRIPEKYGEDGFPHAFIFIGWIGEHLMAHLSNGDSIGDKGIFYFKRDIVNKEFSKYGNFFFVDISPEEAKKQVWSWWQKFWEKVKNYFKFIFS